MAVTVITAKMAAGVNYTHTTDTSADWPSVPNDTYFYDLDTEIVYYKDAAGTVINAYEEGGLTTIATDGITIIGDGTPISPLTAVNNSELPSASNVWVDPVYGNDATGLVERRDKPFATINAAWTAMGTHPRRNNCVFNLKQGTHTLTDKLSDATWGNTFGSARRITFLCEGHTGQTVINYPVTLADNGEVIQLSTNSTHFLTIIGGTWNRTGVATSRIMFNVQASDAREFIIKHANINDSAGTNGIALQRTTELVYDCLITCTNNSYVFQGSGATTSTFKLERSSVDAPTASSFFSSETLRSFRIYDSYINIPTGIIGTANGNIGSLFNNSIINHSGIALDGRALGFNAQNTKFISTTNQSHLVFDTQTGVASLTADGLYFERPDTATQPCIDRSGSGIVKAYIHGRGVYFSSRTALAPSGSDPSTSNSGPNGRVGCVFTASVTIGNQIRMNLTNDLISGTAYNTQPLIYTFASTVAATELVAMKAVIDAQVIIPGTTWNRWTQGDTSLVRVVANTIVVIAHPFAPDYYKISETANYFSETIPGDIVADANLDPDGIVDLVGGPQYPLIDVERRTGFADYPEVLIGPNTTSKIRSF